VIWVRLIGGVLLVLLGLLWIGQGVDLIEGSGMSGQGRWAAIGALVVLGGLWFVWGALQARTRTPRS
jgi:hypothetical protein